jgi:opacity protein-like surface antigen
MKKTILASAIAAAMISTGALAAPAPKLVDYFNVSMGSQAVTDLDSGSAVIGTLGKSLSDHVQNLAAEVEMSKTVGKASLDQTTILGSTSVDADVFSMAGYAVYNIPASPQFTFRGKAGLLYESVTAEACISGICNSADDTNFGLSYGVGATWNVKKNFNILGEYTIVESDVSNLALGIKYDFQ